MSLPTNNTETFTTTSPSPMGPPMGADRPRRRGRRLAAVTVLLVWLAALGVAAANRQGIADWWKLRQYQPPAAISTLAEQDTMTAYGTKIFYLNEPNIESKSSFKSSCPNNGGEQTIVLGCYHSGESGIFLLGVNDPRLDGVEQVTAAHETLHGAYERLSASDRKHVDAMLLDYYHNDLHDPRILQTIDAYKKTEPNDVVNEMHSVFGTEVANLPSGLENYYKRYFTDRAQIVSYASKYEDEFTSREAAVARYDSQLSALKTQIDQDEADLQTKRSQIDTERSQLLAQKNSGDISGYNSGVTSYNGLVDSYNAEVQTVKDLVDRYNQIVSIRNAVALEENQLVQDLSTDVKPIQ